VLTGREIFPGILSYFGILRQDFAEDDMAEIPAAPTPDALRAEFERRGIKRVKVGGFDVDGILRGKYISLEKFWSAFKSGFGFCDVIFGWDIDDRLLDNTTVTGWHTAYPDTHAQIDPTTLRYIPWEPQTAAFIVDFVSEDGRDHPASPRQVLKSVLKKAEAMGFSPRFSSEYEFFIFKESPESIREKGYRNLTPLTPGMFGYSWTRSSSQSAFVHQVLDQLAAYDLEVEGFHTETGPGVYEAAIKYDTLIRAADKSALFKVALKEIGHRLGVLPTFMAKWNAALPGSSGHVHQSLWSSDGRENLFYDKAAPHTMSKWMRHYLAGQVALMPEMCVLIAPTINSYKRMVPGAWAPNTATWGVENRTTALRVIPAGSSATRIEYRLCGADMNPYLSMAAALASGLYGIEKQLEPPPPVGGNAYEATGSPLPRTLAEATANLKRSERARALLGEAFVDHYVRTREWEVREFDRAVTTWELERYIEHV
jgi:glutamine synthetase